MLSNKARWGTLFAVAAMALLGGLYYLFTAVPAGRNIVLYQKVIPWIGLIFSCFSLFFGHFSYPRIHSFKVYFLGYAAGLCGLAYFALCKSVIPQAGFPPLPRGCVEFILVIGLANFVAVAAIPSGVKYRIAKSVTLGVVAAEAVLLSIFRFGLGSAELLRPFVFFRLLDPLLWAGPLLFIAAVLLSIWRVRYEFFLGGIISGSAALYTVAWISRALDPAHADLFHLLILAGVPVYLSASLVVHGFFRMEHRIAYDPLLKIFNRDYCSRIITEQANINVAPPLAVAMVDIDHFKQVNDTYGHQAGDAVLHGVAQAVQRGAGPDAIACRYGGEELAVFFPQRTMQEAQKITEEMRLAIEKIKTRSGKKTIQVTISAGVSCRDNYAQSIVDVIQAADKALYTAKKEGRNQVRTQKTPLRAKDRK
jgi:diguanylate cyclase (GGDEF)-like protein